MSLCEEVDKACRENERELKRAAKRSGMTVQELEDTYWADEAAARKKVDGILADKGATPIEWQFGMNAQIMLLEIEKKQ